MASVKSKRIPLWQFIIAFAVGCIAVLVIAVWAIDTWEVIQQKIFGLSSDKKKLEQQVTAIAKELSDIKSQDQIIINKTLEANIKDIEQAYTKTVSLYEDLLKLKEITSKTKTFDDGFTDILTLLSKRNYASASASIKTLKAAIDSESAKIAASFIIPASVPLNNSAPGSGFSRQSVTANGEQHLVDIIAGDLSTTRVIVDTASDGDCKTDCPVLSLGDYVSRNGGFAGINGSYFCPATYPSCQDKKNSFDTLLMNKKKTYFNSDNNKYSVVPAVIFQGGSVRFVGRSLEWGRDTGIDSMIANQPLLVSGGNAVFGGDGDPKKGSKGPRGFVANKGNTVYIGFVHNATVAEAALVLKALGMENALNLDSGGSSALWFGGYKVGPGRGIPNAIIFVRK